MDSGDRVDKTVVWVGVDAIGRIGLEVRECEREGEACGDSLAQSRDSLQRLDSTHSSMAVFLNQFDNQKEF